jgi:taurine dioxygenase
LRMIDRPAVGGDTVFTNMALAFERLAPEMQAMVEPLRAWHDIGDGQAFRSKSAAETVERAAALVPGAEHPVVGIHPITGRKHLYVNRGFTRHICGVPPTVSAALLAALFEHAERPNFQVRWNWSVGDVVLWDERCTMHYAVADHYPQRREVARVNVISADR